MTPDRFNRSQEPAAAVTSPLTAAVSLEPTAGRAVGRFESQLLHESLEQSRWNQTRAAAALGIARRLLKIKMDRYEITDEGGEGEESV